MNAKVQRHWNVAQNAFRPEIKFLRLIHKHHVREPRRVRWRLSHFSFLSGFRCNKRLAITFAGSMCLLCAQTFVPTISLCCDFFRIVDVVAVCAEHNEPGESFEWTFIDLLIVWCFRATTEADEKHSQVALKSAVNRCPRSNFLRSTAALNSINGGGVNDPSCEWLFGDSTRKWSSECCRS